MAGTTHLERVAELAAQLPPQEQLQLVAHLAQQLRNALPEQPLEAQQSSEDKSEGDAWEALRSLAGSVEGPPDWAVEHDHYLYGTPKRELESDPGSA